MTRKEAINTVRNIYQTDKEKEALEILIPELAESEDERIRKNLIELLLDTPAQDIISHNLELSKVLAYLEKQKEQKPVDEQFPPLEGLDKIKAKYYDEGFKNGFDEGVESVKSAEWREEGEK